LDNEKRLQILSDRDIVAAREEGRIVGRAAGLSSIDLTLIATAMSEVARNILAYAREGRIILGTLNDDGRKCIMVVAEDGGPGIVDVSLAMQDGYSTGKGLGIGLPGARRLMDEFQITSIAGKGTVVTMKKWVRQINRGS
jgi:serine/threonine-protein kinase RsbT